MNSAPAPTPNAKDPELVWYAGYGSNLLRDRFHRYLTGGPTPNSPAGTIEIGARNQQLPVAEWTGWVNISICFAGSARRWGDGGVGFVTGVTTEPATLVRAYLITVEQLEDLHRQENRAHAPIATSISELVEHGSLTLHDGYYSDLIVAAIHEDGRPVVVVGGPETPPRNAPHSSYLETMREGLADGFGLTHQQIASYLTSIDGNRRNTAPTDTT